MYEDDGNDDFNSLYGCMGIIVIFFIASFVYPVVKYIKQVKLEKIEQEKYNKACKAKEDSIRRNVQTFAYQGVDVSHHNDISDLEGINIEFMYIKASEGDKYKDPERKIYAAWCRRHNIPYGYYHVLSENHSAEAQLRNFMQACDRGATLIPAIDIEADSIMHKSKDKINYIANNIEMRMGCLPIMYPWEYKEMNMPKWFVSWNGQTSYDIQKGMGYVLKQMRGEDFNRKIDIDSAAYIPYIKR